MWTLEATQGTAPTFPPWPPSQCKVDTTICMFKAEVFAAKTTIPSSVMSSKVDVEVAVPAGRQVPAQSLRVGGSVHLIRDRTGSVSCTSGPPPPAATPAGVTSGGGQQLDERSSEAATPSAAAQAAEGVASGPADAADTSLGPLSAEAAAQLPPGAVTGTVRSIRRVPRRQQTPTYCGMADAKGGPTCGVRASAKALP